jgi:hypothetical protein
VPSNVFHLQVSAAGFGWGTAQIRKMVDQYPIVFLGHGAIVRSQAGLDVH